MEYIYIYISPIEHSVLVKLKLKNKPFLELQKKNSKMARFDIVYFIILLQISSIMAISKVEFIQKVSKSPAEAPGISGDERQHQHIRLVSRHTSNIPTGGNVILGGFAFALIAAIICYIRVTRRNKNNSKNHS